MTLLEKKQNKLIELLHSQVVDLTMMSKIELGDDVIAECNRISEEIQDIKENMYHLYQKLRNLMQ
jgi:hypothetical protein